MTCSDDERYISVDDRVEPLLKNPDLLKAVDELKKDVKDMKSDMNKWKGAGGIIILLGGLLGSFFYFFMK